MLATGLAATAAQHSPKTPNPKLSTAKFVQSSDAKLRAARWRVLSAHPLALYYYYDDRLGLASLRAHASEITLLGPQCLRLSRDGIVLGEFTGPAADAARQSHLPVMPLVINPGFDRSLASAVLRDPRKRNRAAAYLAFLAKRHNYVGIQIDVEDIDPADKDFFTRFVAEVSARLHREGRLVSVAVTPRFSDTFPGPRNAEFKTDEWGAGFDFRALGRLVDFMTLMTYDQYGSDTAPGPVAGYAWMEKALDYAVRRVPRWKLLLGIPLYDREWIETDHGTVSREVSYPEIGSILSRPGTVLEWNERWRTPWVRYRKGREVHTLWFDNNRSLSEKLGLIRRFGLRGYAAWRLGSESPRFWAVAGAQIPKRRPPSMRNGSRRRATVKAPTAHK